MKVDDEDHDVDSNYESLTICILIKGYPNLVNVHVIKKEKKLKNVHLCSCLREFHSVILTQFLCVRALLYILYS